MNFKIDTKEKFHVIKIKETILSANMTEDLDNLLLPYINASIKNLILDFEMVHEIDESVANNLVFTQQKFYDANCSLVICNLQNSVEDFLDKKDLLEIMNVTATETEAWDIVQMEEMERELGEFDD